MLKHSSSIILMLALGLALIGIALINRQYSWELGREWLAPVMTLIIFTVMLVMGSRRPRLALCAAAR